VNKARLTQLFNEWAARYVADPEGFTLSALCEDGTPEPDYGAACAEYFIELDTELPDNTTMHLARCCFYRARSFNLLPALVFMPTTRVECVAATVAYKAPQILYYHGITLSLKWLAWSGGVAFERESNK
jgi:hypothetical protein